jgi:Hint domain
MATFTWTAATSGLWTTAANWSSGQVPGAGDTAVVTLPGNYLISIPGKVTVGSVVLDDAVATISVGGGLGVTDTLTVTTGAVNVAGVLDVANLANAGVIDNNGTLTVTNLSNTGSIDNTGNLVLAGTVPDNTGTIVSATHGVITVSGSVTAAVLARVGGPGGIVITGTLDNTGGTLGSGGQPIDISGLIQGGTIFGTTGVGAGFFQTTIKEGATIDGVTATGTLDVLGQVTFLDGLTGGPSGPGTLAFTSFVPFATLEFANTETLDNMNLVGDGTITADSTLTINSNVAIVVDHSNLGSDISFDGTGTIINHGTLSATDPGQVPLGSGREIDILNADFENSGVLSAIDASATNGGGLPSGTGSLWIAAATFDNHAGGIIETGQSLGSGFITIAASTNFTNDGTLSTWDQTSGAGGTIDIGAFVQGSGTIEINGGGYVTLETTTSSTQIIDFLGAGTLTLEQPTLVPGVVEGFNSADAIVLNGVSATAISYTSGDLKLQTTSGTFDLAITGDFVLSDFQIGAQPTETSIALACLAAGSRVATDRGIVPVEQLQVGDTVTTVSGKHQPIQWIGHRDVDCRRHPDPAAVWPIRIASHAFGPNMPNRPLLLSPDHAVFVEDMLVPVRYLVNGTTIVQRKVPTVTYYHVELPRHDVLLAEGLPIESYLETGARSAFANGGKVMQLHPDFTPDPIHAALIWEAEGYAPLVVAPAQLEPIRKRLLRQAETLQAARKNRRRTPKAA